MKKKVELPLASPFYSTYHTQGSAGAILYNNKSQRNWYLNNSMVLSVYDENPNGFFCPRIDICQSNLGENPFIESQVLLLTFLDGCVSKVIRSMIDKGYYIYFGAIDDYYMKGKDGYHQYHFPHDGLICGYDQVEKTYSVYAYDINKQYRVFKMPQNCFEKARKSTEKMGKCGILNAVRPMSIKIELDPYLIKEKICDHLNPKVTNNNLEENSIVYGISTHKYLIKYLQMFYEGNIKSECFDLRPFKTILEHKQFMIERIERIEDYFCMDNSVSYEYKQVVKDADLLWHFCIYFYRTGQKNKLKSMIQKVENINYKEQTLLSSLITLY